MGDEDEQTQDVDPNAVDPARVRQLLDQAEQDQPGIREGRYKGPKDTPYTRAQSQQTQPKRIVTIAPRDPFDPQSIADVVEQVRGTAEQTETPTFEMRIAQLESELAELKKEHGDIWPPRPPVGTSDDAGSSGTTREFTLVEDGTGSSGTSTTQCTFRYDVYDAITGELLGSSIGMTGNGRRDLVGKMHAGTRGSGYLDADGDVVLTFADETNFRRQCTPP